VRTHVAMGILAILLSGFPRIVDASGGMIEINQVSALAGNVTPGDTPGFPVTISQSGSYVLTGNLIIADAATSAISITADRVSLDLAGFGILGPVTCSGGENCSAVGPGNGVEGSGFGISVHNGSVEGMGNRGIDLGSGAHVERVVARFNGDRGITVGTSSLLLANRVIDNGTGGIQTGDFTAYADNVIIGSTYGPSVSSTGSRQAVATGGNACDDQRCSGLERQYYLTKTGATGDQALSACATGFHMASVFELIDISNLKYNSAHGQTKADSGDGPPTGAWGWIRTGNVSLTGGGAGNANCSNWTTTTGNGSMVYLYPEWFQQFNTRVDPWYPSASACQDALNVWCVQD